MISKTSLFFACVLAGVALVGCGKVKTSSNKNLAPNLALPVAGENKQWELAPLLGNKAVLLTFYTTWCPYCNRSMPHLESFYQKNRNKNFEIVGVDLEEPEELVVQFRKKYGITFPVLMGNQSNFKNIYPVRYLPTLYFIGKEGNLIRTYEGFHPSMLDEISSQL